MGLIPFERMHSALSLDQSDGLRSPIVERDALVCSPGAGGSRLSGA